MHTEFKTRLVAALSDDPTVAAMLGEADAVHYRRPAKRLAYPAIIYEYDTEYAQAPNREGLRKLALRLRLVGPDPDALDALEAAAKSLLDEAPSALSTETLACRRLRLLRSRMESPGFHDPESSQPLFATVTEWDVWILVRSQP